MVLVETLGDILVKELAGIVKFHVQGIKWCSGLLLYGIGEGLLFSNHAVTVMISPLCKAVGKKESYVKA